MDVYKLKYLKYKQKYTLLKQQYGASALELVNKCDIIYNNYSGSCWNLTLQLLLFISDEFNDSILTKLIENTSDELIDNSNLNVLFTDKYINDNKEIIIKIIDNIKYRFINKIPDTILSRSESFIHHMTNIDYTKEHLPELTEEDLPELTEPGKIKRMQSKYCELNTGYYFFELIYKNPIHFDKRKSNKEGNTLDMFILSNLLSIIFLDKLLVFNYFTKKQKLILPPNTIGIIINILNHVTCFYTCNTRERYSNNEMNIDYNWRDFIIAYNELIDSDIDFDMYIEWKLHPVLDIIGPVIIVKNAEHNYTLLCYNKKQPDNTYIVLNSYDDRLNIFNSNENNKIIYFRTVSYYNKLPISKYKAGYIYRYKNINIFNYLSLYITSFQTNEFFNFMKKFNITIKNLNSSNVIPYNFFQVLMYNQYILNILLSKKLDVNLINVGNNTLLHAACYENNREIVKLLLDKNINITIQNNVNSDTALHVACKYNSKLTTELLINKQIVQLLLDKNIDCNIKNNNGDTPLHIAFNKKKIGIVNLLLNKSDITIQDNNGDTLLHLALKKEDTPLSIIESIIKFKCNFRLKNINGNTPLHVACIRNNFDIVKLLISKILEKDLTRLLSIKNVNNKTPFDIANDNNNNDIKILTSIK